MSKANDKVNGKPMLEILIEKLIKSGFKEFLYLSELSQRKNHGLFPKW